MWDEAVKNLLYRVWKGLAGEGGIMMVMEVTTSSLKSGPSIINASITGHQEEVSLGYTRNFLLIDFF